MQAGVRSLSRNLAAICRHVAVKIVSEQDITHEQAASSSDADESSHDFIHTDDQPEPAGHIQPHTESQASLSRHQQQQQHQQHAAQEGQEHVCSASSQQPQQAEPASSAMERDLAAPTTATSGGFFWGSLWNGLKGAFTPPKQQLQGTKHQSHQSNPSQHQSRARQHQSHASQHQPHATQQTDHDRNHAAAPHMVHASGEHARFNSQQRQTHSSDAIAHMRQAPGRQAGSVGGKQLVSNPYGGVNADMHSLVSAEAASLTVTAELVEEVLGPRKYNETDSADSLVSPGDSSLLHVLQMLQLHACRGAKSGHRQ